MEEIKFGTPQGLTYYEGPDGMVGATTDPEAPLGCSEIGRDEHDRRLAAIDAPRVPEKAKAKPRAKPKPKS